MERRADEVFIGGDPHAGPIGMDYFVWVAIGKKQSFVIDTGFDAETAARRGRNFLRCPAESLKLLGLDAGTIKDVIITHMHYDQSFSSPFSEGNGTSSPFHCAKIASGA
jgi:glyoxylase-like metal-dependent hydrolase (beta-lactamase superfamily II)